ncbi:hypothetical protein Q5H92_02310 [Hymenobacter sp. M29]|uniref:DUF2147 domain-containing protein n=1 Tax=Hymenobacter mellowenesis TaxID=3063995 RepID=A0ABT9A5Q2_9BACT|nr:hypothetical protein [Hymenobacter sp. M29]MDO7845172.1 hypothetical protein [Hymenobacter sp. M29]
MRALVLIPLLALSAGIPPKAPAAGTLFKAKILNGMKGDSLSFVLAPDGKTVRNLTFKGYWRCDGKLEQQRAADPTKGTYAVRNGTISGRLCEPPNGGATAWCFDFGGQITGKTAKGRFRMNINALRCDSYELQWEGVAVGPARK